ncbi:MAG: UDP-N-acetylmuramoyl-tripeptide--D-alanyl-D-alanine ligase [Chitinophagaceae bacterium]|nr:MAG: UDP-N-acetylmuramoyl-tripeptide--D-alanyl-D-alanine ligase [Chitinophagaceae bacterium]
MPDITFLYKIYLDHPSVQTDTRKLHKGDLFFALKGPNFNGNVFAEKALNEGAAYAVVDEEKYKTTDRMILAEDALVALQQLARYHRDQLQIPFLAITGSNGKTTTKELIKSVLSGKYSTYATEGNLNNHIGIPLTILKIKRDIEMAVIEMGANHQHEIEGYCKIADPTHGIITNVGKAHLEGFGGIEGVKKGKGELFDHLRARKGTAFACNDFDYFLEMTHDIKEVIWYGTKNKGSIQGSIVRHDPFLQVQTNYAGTIDTQLIGGYNVYNVLAAVAVGKYYKVDKKDIVNAIQSYAPGNARSQLIKKGDNYFVLDAYNANPSSMKAAIENFANSTFEDSDKKILMLGAMMELGKESVEEHQKVIDLISQYPWEKVILTGGDFSKINHPYLYFPNAEPVRDWLTQQHYHHAAILIKGSRLMQMEKVIC